MFLTVSTLIAFIACKFYSYDKSSESSVHALICKDEKDAAKKYVKQVKSDEKSGESSKVRIAFKSNDLSVKKFWKYVEKIDLAVDVQTVKRDIDIDDNPIWTISTNEDSNTANSDFVSYLRTSINDVVSGVLLTVAVVLAFCTLGFTMTAFL